MQAPIAPTPALPQALGANVPPQVKAKLLGKANEFEAYYVQQFLALTRPDLSDNEIFGGGFSEELFSQKLDEEIAKSVVARGGFGVSTRVYHELLRAQEANMPAVPQSQ